MQSSAKRRSFSIRELQLRRETIAVMKLRGSLPYHSNNLHLRSDAVSPCFAGGGSRGDNPQPIRILSISDYDGLRVSRELLLAQTGYCTESCASSAHFDVLAVRRFHIAVLCHSIAADRAIRIAELLHRDHPRIRVLRLNPSERSGTPCFDQDLDCFISPEELLRVIREEADRIAFEEHIAH